MARRFLCEVRPAFVRDIDGQLRPQRHRTCHTGLHMSGTPKNLLSIGFALALSIAPHCGPRGARAQRPLPPPLSKRAFAPLLTKAPSDACRSKQPSVPPKGLWSFVVNFDSDAPLQGCLIDFTGAVLTFTTLACEVSDSQHVTFLESDSRKFARFDGQGSVLCPNFDPPGDKILLREKKTLIAVARPVSGSGARQNPLITHPFTPTALLDLAWSMPILPNGNGISVGYQTTMRIGGQMKHFTSTIGLLPDSWNVMATDSKYDGFSQTVITHTINDVPTDVFTTTGDIFFYAGPVTLTIAYDPTTQEYFLGDIDELILDPRAGKGTY